MLFWIQSSISKAPVEPGPVPAEGEGAPATVTVPSSAAAKAPPWLPTVDCMGIGSAGNGDAPSGRTAEVLNTSTQT